MLIPFTITECEKFERYNCDDDKHRIVVLTTYSYFLLYFENIINLLIKKMFVQNSITFKHQKQCASNYTRQKETVLYIILKIKKFINKRFPNYNECSRLFKL